MVITANKTKSESVTVTCHWFFADIVDHFSPSNATISTTEARKILVLNRLIERTEIFRQSDRDSTLIIPNLDGMAIGFKDSPEKPLLLAIEVHKTLNRYNSLKKRWKGQIILKNRY
ncbi:MAG: hypothetical protein M3044_03960 [Thermoproteota archaeon]|nr:hypothetical protein [Thermoproteota archaeon]